MNASVLLGFLLVSICGVAEAANDFTSTGALGMARHAHTATLLPNGKVLVAGGGGASGILASAELFDPATGTWASTGSMSTARIGHNAVVLPNGKVLVVGGIDTGNAFLASAEIYDPVTGTWTTTGSMSLGRSDGVFLTLLPNGKVLAAGGKPFPGGATPAAELYDPVTGTWTPTGSMTTPRSRHVTVLLPNGKVLALGGGTPGGVVATAELYDPANGTWASTGSMSTVRMVPSVVLLPNGKVLVTGGWGQNEEVDLASAEIYDFQMGIWTSTGSMSAHRVVHTATLLPNGKVLVAGGSFGDDIRLASAELYDPQAGTWSASGSLGTARSHHTATLLPNGKVFIAGGFGSSGVLASAELFCPEMPGTAGVWTATGILGTRRYNHTATLLTSGPSAGKVLLTGGDDGGGPIASTELYDSVTGNWTPTGSLATIRVSHTATLLSSGKVLVVGGWSYNWIALASAELYDPVTGTWTSTGSMSTGRANFSATLLSNGKVLVAGGQKSGGSGVAASVELYDPATGTWTITGSLSTGRTGHSATLLSNGKVLVAGGTNTSSHFASAEIYDPATGGWTSTGSLISGRNWHAATLLMSGASAGMVLVAGGGNSSGPLPSADLYDSAIGTWTSTGSLATQRMGLIATLLPNGKVLVSGGCINADCTSFMASTELYDPASGAWTTIGNLAMARRSHTATLLPTGQVLVAGGLNSSGVLSSAELYSTTVCVVSAPVITSISPTSGFVGSSVTIIGSNFGPTQGSSVVIFNGVTASVSSWSNTQIVATVPVGATTGPVIVTVNAVASNNDKIFTVLQDTIVPTTTASATPPANGAGWNNTNVTVTLSALDNADGSGVASITYTLTGAQTGGGSVAASSTSILITTEGVTTVTYHATDNVGNVEAGHTVTIKLDTTAPVIGAVSNLTAEATSAAGAVVAVTLPTATDVVDATPTVSVSPASGSTFSLGVTTVTVTATDDAGNSSTKTFTVTVQDTTTPNLTVPASLTTSATSPAGAVVSYSSSATDLVDVAPTLTCAPASGTTFAVGSTTVTCTATDFSGNSSNKSFQVTVEGPAAQIQSLTVLVQSFNLQQGLENSLDAKLQNAFDALNSAITGNIASACNKLSAFINEVQAQSGTKITSAQASQLIAAAGQIKAASGCP